MIRELYVWSRKNSKGQWVFYRSSTTLDRWTGNTFSQQDKVERVFVLTPDEWDARYREAFEAGFDGGESSVDHEGNRVYNSFKVGREGYVNQVYKKHLRDKHRKTTEAHEESEA